MRRRRREIFSMGTLIAIVLLAGLLGFRIWWVINRATSAGSDFTWGAKLSIRIRMIRRWLVNSWRKKDCRKGNGRRDRS